MKKEFFFIGVCFTIITALFFHPIFKGYIPFPGDLLIGGYAPYKTYLFLGYAPGGYPNKGQSFDVLRLIYPGKEFSIDMLKHFQVPLWDPYIFSGTPHLASLQPGTFYVFNFIFFLLPYISAWTIYIVIQPFLAGIFTYFLLREFGLQMKSSLFGGMVFAFSSYMVVWMEYGNLGHTIIWLPLAMWLALKTIQKATITRSVFIILVLSFSILAGYIQTTFYVFVFLFAFVVFTIVNTRQNRRKNILVFFLIFIYPVFLTAVQLLPTIELILQSARSQYTTESLLKLLIPQIHVVTLFVPDFFGNPATRNYWLPGTYIERISYIGVLPLFFVLYGCIQKQTRITVFFIMSMVITYLLVFDTIVSRLFYSLQLPFISTAVPSRLMFLFCFAASILAAFGYDAFEKNKKRPLFKVACIMGAIYIALWVFVYVTPWIENISIAKRNLILPTTLFFGGVLLLLACQKWIRFKKYQFIIIFTLTIVDLFYFFHKITPFAPVASVYPQTEVFTFLKQIQGIDRSWGYGSGRIETNIQLHEKLFTTDGYDALYIKRYGELVSASKDGEIANQLQSNVADIAPGFGDHDLRDNRYRQTILNLLGAKYILHRNDLLSKESKSDYQTFPEELYRLIWQKGVWQIYENKKALARFFLISNYIVETNKQRIINTIFDEKIDLKKTVVLEQRLPSNIQLGNAKDAKVTLKKYEPNEVIFETSASSDTLLFLSDNYFPGWKVTIDHDPEPATIYRANYSFRSVPVPKGKHQVIFWYYPKSFDLGLKITVISFVIGLFIVLYLQFKKVYV